VSATKYLAFDLGQSSAKVTLGTFDGGRLAFQRLGSFENSDTYVGGMLQWDMLVLYKEVMIGIRKAIESQGVPASIGIDSWGTDHSFTDKGGFLLGNPLSNRDRGIERSMRDFYQVVGKRELFEATGVQLSRFSSSSLMQIYHQRALGSEKLSFAKSFLMIPDILNYYLCGVAACEVSLMSFTQLYDQKNGKLSELVLDRYAVPSEAFQRIVEPGNVLGAIRGDICDSPKWKKIRVVNPLQHDTASAFAAVLDEKQGKKGVAISIGSWCCLGTAVQRPLLGEDLFAKGFANQRGEDGITHLRKDIPGLLFAESCKKELSRKGNEMSWEDIVRRAEGERRGDRFIDLDGIMESAANADPLEQINDYLGKTKQAAIKGPDELFRAIFLGICFGIRRAIEELEQITGTGMDLVYLLGGGSKNKLMCQWVADLLKKPVHVGMYDAAAIGNILSQMLAAGEIGSFSEGRALSSAAIGMKEVLPSQTDALEDLYLKYREQANQRSG
jgi:rhamnulokinase